MLATFGFLSVDPRTGRARRGRPSDEPAISVAATVEQDATGRLATARLVPPYARADEVVVDMLFASSGVEPELVAAAEIIDVLPDLGVPVARVGDLIALKILARDDCTRPQDAADPALCADLLRRQISTRPRRSWAQRRARLRLRPGSPGSLHPYAAGG